MKPQRPPFRLLPVALLLVALAASLLPRSIHAATPIPLANAGFEEGELGQLPAGWSIPEADQQEGYAARTVTDNPQAGARCLLFATPNAPKGFAYGELRRNIDATLLRGKRIRFHASARIEGTPSGPRARLALTFLRASQPAPNGPDATSDPIVLPTWKGYDVLAEVPSEASEVQFELVVLGDAKAWFDGLSLEVLGTAGEGNEPARPLSERGLANLQAFAHLYGYVRYFHPSDEAASADWNAVALAGVQRAEGAESPAELARALDETFHPLAPTLRVYPSSQPAPPIDPTLRQTPAGSIEILGWQHSGIDLSGGAGGNIYSSRRSPRPLGTAGITPGEPFRADLGAGVAALVPLALYKDGKGTLPHRAEPKPVPPAAKPEGFLPTGNDRATRLADVVVAWNVFQHFYPYFDVVQTDWPAELAKALRGAASDPDAAAFTRTLKRLVAALHDGHGNALGPGDVDSHRPPILWDWVEGQLAITAVMPGTEGVERGDLVIQVDGRPSAEAMAAEESLSSGATPQWIRHRALQSLLAGPSDRDLRLELRHADGTNTQLALHRNVPLDSITSAVEPRPDKLTEIRPGIFYLDVDRITDDDIQSAMERLAAARGIVIDFRGYPSNLSTILIAHLIDQTVTSAQWHVPQVTRPDHAGMEFSFSNWPVEPAAPRFHGKVAFLTNGGAISYAETYLGIVENYKLGAIVGGATAGTNGNINPFTLLGGYRLIWTGMQVLKHDGSRHHGVGIQPTVPVSRTLAGVATGRDEVLEKGIEVVSQ